MISLHIQLSRHVKSGSTHAAQANHLYQRCCRSQRKQIHMAWNVVQTNWDIGRIGLSSLPKSWQEVIQNPINAPLGLTMRRTLNNCPLQCETWLFLVLSNIQQFHGFYVRCYCHHYLLDPWKFQRGFFCGWDGNWLWKNSTIFSNYSFEKTGVMKASFTIIIIIIIRS